MQSSEPGVYLITQGTLGVHPTEVVVEAALEADIDVVQLREKGHTAQERYELGVTLRELTATAGVPLIVNDRIDLAAAIDADGVHLGDDDLPVAVAREQLGADAIVGRSVSTPEKARAATAAGADYLGVGAVYETSTKGDVAPENQGIGIDGLRAVVEATTLPVYAIGGITVQRASRVIEAGADGVAVISAIVAATEPGEATAALKRTVTRDTD